MMQNANACASLDLRPRRAVKNLKTNPPIYVAYTRSILSYANPMIANPAGDFTFAG